MQLAASLTRVDFCVSTSCSDPSGDVAWTLLRDFGRWSSFLHAFGDRVVHSELMPGDTPLQIGARRVLHIGTGKLVEQLSALDQDNKTLSYKLITHPLNVNPFNASFVNYTCQVSVRAITMTSHSFVEMRGSFMTEPNSAEAMQLCLTCFHEACLRGLGEAANPTETLQPAASMPLIGVSAVKRVGVLDGSSGINNNNNNGSFPALTIGRTFSAHPQDIFGPSDRQNSTDSTRSQMDGHASMQ